MKLNEIKSIIKDFESSTLTVLELETENVKLKLSKNKEQLLENKSTEVEVQNPVQQTNNVPVITTTTLNPNAQSIKSPLVGTFYESSTPSGKPFVKVGDTVKKGQVVCIVEAMKIMNEITSAVDGKIEKILFKNGDVVGFDDILFTVVQ
ncbi:Biotin carboxyl carrier protein of acetyl-CoA carboxylase [Acholeplasma oculi]|uniref:Biotin carboxyl carrier protein of acetyl-CoA carboxylase n=1 Tax=Acholeplasma oculi TaxID=35623 RepID=A0A061AGI2_9MOLU|nr:acetyl-CoA carboxylase biotin carboxyl carrier protein [Acholeplasma oculi]CDR30671.1 Biotin carboxyl carrier protein of acetyl-CoA carboxylase [Acholeplasma oculi]SKC34628.1 acetyl-CoA carboxylase biotin carboxyl carrier protein [Acholeplasma oculi]SUT89455.1 Biotin carboxyl carrier protein of acetyl-CoA carboxylase [Acholeplasma oculi]